MNKVELIEKVAVACDVSKKAAGDVVDNVFESIKEALSKKEEVKISGFGNFEVKEVKERNGINPITKEKIKIKASKKVSFKASESLKDSIK